MSVLRAIIVAACPDMGPPKFPIPSESQQRGMQALSCAVNGYDTQSLLDGLIPTRPGNETTTGNAVSTKQVLVAVVYVLLCIHLSGVKSCRWCVPIALRTPSPCLNLGCMPRCVCAPPATSSSLARPQGRSSHRHNPYKYKLITQETVSVYHQCSYTVMTMTV